MTPQVGDFGVTRTYGNLRGRLAALAIQYGTDSPYNHAVLYIGKGRIVEAEPGGARLSRWDRYDADSITWSTGRLPDHLTPTAVQRLEIARIGKALVGTPYGWADIVCIALAQKRLGTVINPGLEVSEQPAPWRQVLGRIGSSRKMICSQLVDYCYQQAGVHLFDDGRFEGMVSPGDLYRLLEASS